MTSFEDDPDYEECIVTFVDILGFRDLLAKKTAAKIREILSIFRPEAQPYDDEQPRNRSQRRIISEVKMEVISDAVVRARTIHTNYRDGALYQELLDLVFILALGPCRSAQRTESGLKRPVGGRGARPCGPRRELASMQFSSASCAAIPPSGAKTAPKSSRRRLRLAARIRSGGARGERGEPLCYAIRGRRALCSCDEILHVDQIFRDLFRCLGARVF